ncbi:disease resistance protein RPM1-like [Neltuma alba]|uniref:disease resistance protein RPM1-like n=1 Tax=Neltuma alba TaxID=207710 RepID=UPI0010A488E3|nr:disease resistance protein RPM1-like [Prosopis alba]
MAETAVNLLIDKLIALTRKEAGLLKGVEKQIEQIKDELELIRAYIKDADHKADIAETSNYLVKEWVRQMREVAYRMQDVMDEYLFKVEMRRQERRRGLVGVARRICHLLRSIIPRHEIASEIMDIRESMAKLNEKRQFFGFYSSLPQPSNRVAENSSSSRRYLRLAARFMDDSHLVGFDHTRKLLSHWLSDKDSRRTVISVVGEGGLGKTTIASNLYEQKREERCFDCYAWISVSGSLSGEKLLKSMIQSFYEYDGGNENAAQAINEIMDGCALTSKLREYLQDKRYMIVLDDIRDKEFWKSVEFALPDNNKSSRIMISTRDEGVADFCRSYAPVHIHKLDPLPEEDALKLFHLKVFQFDDLKGCPENLLEISRDFVNKCDRVPLAIVAIAGLLSTKKKATYEWESVLKSLRSKLASDPHLKGYYQVLSESYKDLDYHLKLCLLYFGIFPEGYSISCSRLVNLWIAEGFVKKNENEDHTTLEEAGEEYLSELIRRNLVKISTEYPYSKVRRCRVHDLMHGFILKTCEEINFCQVKNSEVFGLHRWTRRLSIQMDAMDALEATTNYERVRSNFVFKQLPKPVIESFLSGFKLLIILDLENAPIDDLPRAVRNLVHLKYLSLRGTKIKSIPKFIGKLQNLESLDLKHSLVGELPEEINKLVKLRRLLAYYFPQQSHTIASLHGVSLKEGIGCLKALEKLAMIDVTDGDALICELKSLKLMRNLSIKGLQTRQGQLLCGSIESMSHLCALCIVAIQEHEVIDLESINDPPLNLQRLYLSVRMEKLPTWIVKLKNLVRLRLEWSGLNEDPLSVLKDLPELLELQLWKSFEGEELHFKDGWFRKLKSLDVLEMQDLKTLRIDKAALPILETLQLVSCPQLAEMPTGIQNLENLKLLYLVDMSDQMITDLKSKEERSYDKIKEITIVTSFSKGFYRRKLEQI